MSENNPYQAPAADLVGMAPEAGLNDPRSVPVGRGAGWIGDSFELFRRQWGLWILAGITMFIINFILGFIPIIGGLAQVIIGAAITGGFMIASRGIDRNEPITFGTFFEGFSNHFGPLALLGLAYLGCMIVVLIVAGIIGMLMGMGGAAFSAMMDPEAAAGAGMAGLAIMVLVFLGLLVPVVMAYWFAPALIVFHNVPVIKAMGMSFKGCLKNILPFLLYGLLGLVLIVLGSIPLGLGLLVVMPMLIASVYVSYKEIFE